VAGAVKEPEATRLAVLELRLLLVEVLIRQANALSDEFEIRVVSGPVGASVVTAVNVHASRIGS
jgi:hypothetical protein